MSYGLKIKFQSVQSASPCLGFGVRIDAKKWHRFFMIMLRWRRPCWEWYLGSHSIRYGCSWIELGCFYLGYNGWTPRTKKPGEYDTLKDIRLETLSRGSVH